MCRLALASLCICRLGSSSRAGQLLLSKKKRNLESDIYSAVSLWHITILPWPTPARETFTSAVYDEVRQRSYNSDCYRPYLVDNDEWFLDSRHVSICQDRHCGASPRQEVILILSSRYYYSSLLLLFISEILLFDIKRNENCVSLSPIEKLRGSTLRHPALAQPNIKRMTS